MIVTANRNDPLARLLTHACHAADWRLEKSSDTFALWIYARHRDIDLPIQGWKLHISANVSIAPEVCAKAMAVLVAEQVNFKIAASLDLLRRLNAGEYGASQVGKFITVYPRNDAEAVHIAHLLDNVLQGVSGPSIPSDRPLYPGSIVFYRYGAFSSSSIQTAVGELVAALRGPNGEFIEDRRTLQYVAPGWVHDPILAAGVARELPVPARLIAKRYLIICSLFASLNHTIYLAADLEAERSCVIKGPGFAHQTRVFADIANQPLAHEAAILRRLSGDPCFPTVFDVVEQDNLVYLIMEDIEGTTLDVTISHATAQGRNVPLAQAIQWGFELASIIATVHAQGMIYSDLKSSNVIVTSMNHLRLIDFELAHDQGEDQQFRGRGTRGYMSPQQARGDSMTVHDDIYSFGAVLYALFTGAEPAIAPQPFALLERPLCLFRRDLPPEVAALVARCLAPDPALRYPTMLAVADALLHAKDAHLAHPPSHTLHAAPTPTAEACLSDASFAAALRLQATDEVIDPQQAQAHYGHLAHRLGDTLCAVAYADSDRTGCYWKSAHPILNGLASLDLNAGDAGALLALAAVAATTREPQHLTCLTKGATWLAEQPRASMRLPGLYVGQAGIGTALLFAGLTLAHQNVIDAALAFNAPISAMDQTSPDLFNGTAGRLRFHLLCWHATNDPQYLAHAQACGAHLVATAASDVPGEYSWSIPLGFGGLSGKTYLGYAHGAAGIADALLDLFEATQDERWLPVIQGAGRWLAKQAATVCADQQGYDWPKVPDAAPEGPLWCHGATGVGQFFLHAARAAAIAGAEDTAQRAALTVARASLILGPTMCHGLAGNIDFLIDIYQMSHDPLWSGAAFRLARALDAFALDREALLMFPSESPTICSPDYMIGYAGMIPCLIRLARPAVTPQLLSCAGIQFWPKFAPDV